MWNSLLSTVILTLLAYTEWNCIACVVTNILILDIHKYHIYANVYFAAPKGHLFSCMLLCVESVFCFPTDSWHNNNVIITSKRRRFDVIITLFLRHASVGLSYITLSMGYTCYM